MKYGMKFSGFSSTQMKRKELNVMMYLLHMLVVMHKIQNFSTAELLNDFFPKLWLILNKTLYHILF